ncbi:MAG: nucleoside 2-deoxyribosyltransferase [Burkholderiaceae bacterium]
MSQRTEPPLFIPLSPADGDPIDCAASELSQRIYLQNFGHIDAADIVMANVQDFRGHEPHSGTVFDIGYAIGRGKAVWCYNVPTSSLIEQIACEQVAGDSAYKDRDGYTVGNFGWSRNLMLVHACHFVTGDAQSCIQAIGKYYQQVRAEQGARSASSPVNRQIR